MRWRISGSERYWVLIGSHIISSRRLPLPYCSVCARAPDTQCLYSRDVKQTLQECLLKSWIKEVWEHIGEDWNELRIKPSNTLGCSVTSGLLGSIEQISLSASDRQSWSTIIYLAACLQLEACWLLSSGSGLNTKNIKLKSPHLFAECQNKPLECFQACGTL